MFSERRTPTYIRVWKGIHGIRDFAKKRCRIRDLTAHGKRDSPKLGMGCGIAIKKKVGCGIFIKKERECGIRTPPFQTLLHVGYMYVCVLICCLELQPAFLNIRLKYQHSGSFTVGGKPGDGKPTLSISPEKLSRCFVQSCLNIMLSLQLPFFVLKTL